MEEFLLKYKEEDLTAGRLKVEFVGEFGEDFGGLTKEAFTSFWHEVSMSLFRGEGCIAPFLPLYRMRSESWKFTVLGKILAHTVSLTGCLPARLSRAGLVALIFDQTVSEEILIQDFLEFVTPSEKALLLTALNNFSALSNTDKERMQTLYTVFECDCLVKGDEVSERLATIAENVLVEKPNRLYRLMKKGIPSSHFDVFWSLLTVDHIDFMVQQQRPTPEKVIQVVKTREDDLTNSQERVLHFFKEFIRSLDVEELSSCLLFITGCVYSPKEIMVSFNGLVDSHRRPIAHTCSNEIELSSTYAHYQEFRRELKTHLGNEQCFRYDQV